MGFHSSAYNLLTIGQFFSDHSVVILLFRERHGQSRIMLHEPFRSQVTSLKFFLNVIQLNASLRSWGKDLIVKQILLVSTSGNLCRRLWRKWILMLGCNRLTPLKPSVGHCFLKKLLAWSFQIVDICVLWPTHKGFYLFSSCILHL